MEKFFSVGQTANTVGMTAETLRHYDRIGLVKPCRVDEWTGYRYYSHREIVMLNTIRALRVMDLSLDEIKKILAYDDLSEIIEFLKRAEKSADDKIAELNFAKSKIIGARKFYESKRSGDRGGETFIEELDERVILLSDELMSPSVENLWDYHRHFYKQVGDGLKDKFAFEDLAGIYESDGRSSLFAVCVSHAPADGILRLPHGRYLCAYCTENNRRAVTDGLFDAAKRDYGVEPKFAVHLVVLTGILQWNYKTQIFIE